MANSCGGLKSGMMNRIFFKIIYMLLRHYVLYQPNNLQGNIPHSQIVFFFSIVSFLAIAFNEQLCLSSNSASHE